MKETTDKEIAEIEAAWGYLKKSITLAGYKIRSIHDGSPAVSLYEGYKTVLAMLAENYVNQVHIDPRRPELTPTVGTMFNHAGPAPDFNYYLIHIEPGKSYRIWGKRGDCELIDLQMMTGWYGKQEQFSLVTHANILFDSSLIECDREGNFNFIIGPQQSGDQWLEVDPSVTTIMIREYFTDYATQVRRSTFHVDNLSVDQGVTRTPAAEGAKKIRSLARSIKDYAYTLNLPEVTTSQVGDNAFFELNYDNAGGSLNHRYIQARWSLKSGQALVGKWMFPEQCLNWSIVLYNDSYQVLNCVNRQINLNAGNAIIPEDRMFYFVLSFDDPGIVNWLDLDGHDKGQILIRTKDASDFILPELQLVDFSDIHKVIPSTVKKISPEDRAEQLAVRRKHFQLRELR